MNMDGNKRICGMLMVVLLVVSAVPAGAETLWTTRNDFDLQLAAAQNDETFGFDASAAKLAADEIAQQIEVNRLNLVQRQRVSEIGQQVLMQSSGNQGAPSKKGKGRWLKRHWYIPVLAAVALGAAFEVGGDDKDDVDDD